MIVKFPFPHNQVLMKTVTISVLVWTGHAINLGPQTSEHFHSLLLRLVSLWNIDAFLNCSPLINLFNPFLQCGEFRQVNFQRRRRSTNPRETRDVGNGVFGSRQIGTFLQAEFKDREETFGLIKVPLNPVIWTCAAKETEVICLTFAMWDRERVDCRLGNAPCIGPSPPIWNINQQVCSTCSGVPGA